MILCEDSINKALSLWDIIIHDWNSLLSSSKLVKAESIDVRLWRYLFIREHIPTTSTTVEKWIDLNDYPDGYQMYPWQFVLSHTEEFIWTRANSRIHPTFKIKSSSARLGIIHTLAWHWEVGFHNRWAMEFTVAIPIVLKRFMSIGQIYFSYTDWDWDYSEKWTYQKSNDIEEIVKNWKKEDILPPKELKVVY